jgi:hypothetical protein
MSEPDPEDVARVTRALGQRPRSWKPARGHGAPSNRRWVIELPSGATAFVKIAAYDYTAEWLRTEHANYVELASLPCVPRLLGWDDDGVHPALVLEDLSEASWPPPWSSAQVDAVLSTLETVHATTPLARMRRPQDHIPDLAEGWRQIRADPEPFLSIGICSRAWLEASVDALEAASDEAVIDGDALIHFDVRSDNLCFRERGVTLVDWNLSCRAAGAFDVAAWLPSLSDEGGPDPWDVMPGAGNYASVLAGFFCGRGGLSPIPQAPHARPLQRSQGRVALNWASRELGLPPPA